jgi:hypothetical protein
VEDRDLAPQERQQSPRADAQSLLCWASVLAVRRRLWTQCEVALFPRRRACPVHGVARQMRPGRRQCRHPDQQRGHVSVRPDARNERGVQSSTSRRWSPNTARWGLSLYGSSSRHQSSDQSVGGRIWPHGRPVECDLSRTDPQRHGGNGRSAVLIPSPLITSPKASSMRLWDGRRGTMLTKAIAFKIGGNLLRVLPRSSAGLFLDWKATPAPPKKQPSVLRGRRP